MIGSLRWQPIGVGLLLAALADVRESPQRRAVRAWGDVAAFLDIGEQGREARRATVASVIALARQDARSVAHDHRAEDELDRELAARGLEVRSVLGMAGDPPTSDADALEEQDGMHAPIARFASYIEGIGALGRETAESIRRTARTRWETRSIDPNGLWSFWTPDRFGSYLARILWSDVVSGRPWTAVIRSVYMPVFVGLTSKANDMELRRTGETLELPFHPEIPALPILVEAGAYDLDTMSEIMTKARPLFRTVLAHRVLRHLVIEGQRQCVRNEQNPGRLFYDGGWSAFASAVMRRAGESEADVTSHKTISEVRAIVRALQLLNAQMETATHKATAYGLLNFTEYEAKGQRRAGLSITLNDVLLPHAPHMVRRGAAVESRVIWQNTRLVPITDIPPLVGRPLGHGGQITLSMLVVAEMRERAVEIPEQGGVLIPPDRWPKLAELAGVERTGKGAVGAVLERWQTNAADGPAFLERIGPDRFLLGPAHQGARIFLSQSGEIDRQARAQGKARMAAKAGARRKHSHGAKSTKK